MLLLLGGACNLPASSVSGGDCAAPRVAGTCIVPVMLRDWTPSCRRKAGCGAGGAAQLKKPGVIVVSCRRLADRLPSQP